jgi:GMP synthase (glutamine-hydrolysing)
MLGICFGHQLMAHAFGGTVGRTATSVEFATVAIERTAADQDDPLLSYLPRRFIAQVAHFEIVTAPPTNAHVLARNVAGIQALDYGSNMWGVQFHPELDDTHMKVILDNLDDPESRGIDVEASRKTLRPSEGSAQLLKRFWRLATGPARS